MKSWLGILDQNGSLCLLPPPHVTDQKPEGQRDEVT